MSVFLMIHGIKDSRASTTQVMGGALEDCGHDVYHVDQTTVEWWQSYSRKDQMTVMLECLEIARSIYEMHGKFSVFAHSNGCLVAQYLVHNLEDGRIKNMYLANPALDKDWTWNQRENSFDRAHVIYDPSDWACWVASLLPGNNWGDMGRHGPVTDDPRVEGKRNNMRATSWGHNAVFVPPADQYWARQISQWERESEEDDAALSGEDVT